MAFNASEVKSRVLATCPEAANVTDAALDIYVGDAVAEVGSAFLDSEGTGINDSIRVKAGAALASHFCTVNVFQQSWTLGHGGSLEPPTGGDPIINNGSLGGIKKQQYKDKTLEYHEPSKNDAIGGAGGITKSGSLSLSQAALATTSYGVEYIRLCSLYIISEPFLLGTGG